MSKKYLQSKHVRTSSLTLESDGQAATLFSRKSSNARPFVISDIDSPYEKQSSDYISTARHARSPETTRLLGALGVQRVSRHTTRRSRRIIAFGLVAFVVFAVNYYRTGSQYLKEAPSSASSAVPSQLRRLWNHAMPGAISARSVPGEDTAIPSPSHTFHPNGLLLVNPNGRHPIHVLIESAEKKWEALLDKQSKTLGEAVQEYKRRYRRNPPKGFEHWWNFAQANKVQLVDEYDQISKDFAPFWALEPNDMRHRNKVMQDREHTFTLSIKDGKTTSHGQHADLQRATDMANLLNKFSKFVPGEVNMTFIIDDQPAVMMGWNQRERMLELASQGEYWGAGEFVEPEPSGLTNLAKACPPNSAIRHAEQGNPISNYGSKEGARSFIHDHSKAVDICSHPEFKELHGYTSNSQLGLTPLVPLFTWAKTGLQSDILVTPLEQFDDDYGVYDPPFEFKPKNKLMWRGSTTGAEFRKDVNWEQSQRARLHFMAAEKEGKNEVMWSNDEGAMLMSNATNRVINRKYMDVSFSGVPAQCDAETCEKMREVIDFKPTMGLEEQNQYRYLFDVDGNGWSGRFNRLLSTNAAVLKSTIFPEWYQDRIVPWVHYIPVKVDYSDLYDIMAFFVGNPENGKGSHEKLAERIAMNGKAFTQQHWRRVDMAAYMYRLVLEYARLLHQDEDEVDYYGESRY